MEVFLTRKGMSMVSSRKQFFFHVLFISGWGDTGAQETSTDELQKTVIPIVPSISCLERMSQTEKVDDNLIVCAGGAAKGPCKVIQNLISDVSSQ